MKRLLLLATLLFAPSQLVLADISNPYVVDEKAQVIFGDSVQVGSYKGLENYTYDYVNNYLHITFTYTHAGFNTFCCFAAYPPRIYITNVDPTSTSTISVRSNLVIYTLLPRPIPPGHETDWYLYDIQFDATGYNVLVKQAGATTTASFHIDIAGLSTSDWASLANLFPIFFNQPNINSMAFTPRPVYYQTSVPVATTTPVIIVPGISSTYLYKNGNSNLELWPNISQMLVSINDSYLDDLSLLSTGEESDMFLVTPRNIIRDTGGNDFFNGLFSTLNLAEYTENEDVFEFPYDWRLDIEDTALDLKERIDEIKAQRGVEKVNLVAHSMGGLLVKKYLKDFGGGSVEKFVDISTPHTGAPKAFKILSYGDNFGASILFGLLGLNSERIKIISQNMPAVYQLLPSESYFADYDYYVFDAANGEDRLSYKETGDYMKSSGRNSSLVDRAEAFHQEIDSLDPADFGVETYNFVGCGTPTIGQFFILQGGERPKYNIRMINGDGTVPLRSAEAMEANSTYYVRGAQHALMPSTVGVRDLITEILASTSTGLVDLSPYPNILTSASGCDIPNGKIVSFHSPIDLHIYDSAGNHSGPDSHGDIESEIAGVIYEVIEGNKFAYLPDGADYEIRGVPTGTGTFDVRVQTLNAGEVSSLSYWHEVPIEEGTQIAFEIGSDIPDAIDGVPVSSVLVGVQALDTASPSTELEIKGNLAKDGTSKTGGDSYISSVRFSLSATDDASGVLKTEYSLDGGASWSRYTKPVVINTRGGVELKYRSVDKAGNVEPPNSKLINIIWPGNSGKKR